MKVVSPVNLAGHLQFLDAYTITTSGQVLSKRDVIRAMVQREHLASRKSFKIVDLSYRGQQWRVFVHVLVALAHVPRPGDDGFEPRHKNGDVHDNRAVNLEWVDIAHKRAVDQGRTCPTCGTPFKNVTHAA